MGMWACGLLQAALLAVDPAAANGGGKDRLPDPSALRFKDLSTADSAGPPASPAATPAEVDLSYQFPDEPNRNQVSVGACSIFATVALMEAAYFRQYGRRLILAEGDLFVNATIRAGRPGMANLIEFNFHDGGELYMLEGNDEVRVLRYALDHGLATGYSWRALLDRYLDYRRDVLDDAAFVEKLDRDGTWLSRYLSKEYLSPRQAYLDAFKTGEADRALQMFLTQRDWTALQSERASTKDNFAGFTPKTWSFRPDGRGWKTPASCGTDVAFRRSLLVENLASAQPVMVGMDVAGMAAWDSADSRRAGHAFVVTGYRRESDSRFVFLTRNSWGGDNPEVREDELCRIMSMTTLRAPKDR